MERKIIETLDGSKTIQVEGLSETYHSVNGALVEAIHVFIEHGLSKINKEQKPIKILEIGFGTGLNCLLTAIFSQKLKLEIQYFGIEKYPITKEEFQLLNYAEKVSAHLNENRIDIEKLNQSIFDATYNQQVKINQNFTLQKVQLDFFDLGQLEESHFDLVYFDAFGSHAQPELWEEKLIQIVTDKLANDSIFTTYAAKGNLKRALQKFGFTVEKYSGPPGKREMMVGKRGIYKV